MPVKQLLNSTDAYVNGATAYRAKNYGSVSRLYLGTNIWSYMFWSNPVPPKAAVPRAVLRVYAAEAMPSGTVIDIHLLTAQWSVTKVTWNSKPAVTSTGTIRHTLSAAVAANGLIEIPIATLAQSISNGTKWFGIRLSTTSTTRRSLHSAQASNSALRPVVEVEWSEAPMPPTNLSPRAGGLLTTPKPVLLWNFVDYAGDRNQASYQVQISTNSAFTSIVYDSGALDGAEPQHSLAGTAFNASAGTTYYWRVKTKDGAGFWSEEWSAFETFGYLAPFTVTLTSPTTANPYVEDPSPVILWQLSGSSVTSAWEMTLYDDAVPGKPLWTSGRVTSAPYAAFSIPGGYITQTGKTYRVDLKVWDDKNRVDSVGAPAYAFVSQKFDFRKTTSISPVTSISLVQDPVLPWEEVVWKRATTPDSFTLYRNGVAIVTNIDPLNVQDPADPTQYRLKTMSPGRATHFWEVAAVENGRSSGGNALVTKEIYRKVPWICGWSHDFPVPLMEPQITAEDREMVQLVEPMEGDAYLIEQDVSGEVGTISGVLVNDEFGSLTAKQMKENLRYLRKARGGAAKLLWSDEVMTIYIYDLKIERLNRHTRKTEYGVSMSFVSVSF